MSLTLLSCVQQPVGDEGSSKTPVIKEGLVEKKGHSMAYFNWAVRHLVVRQGVSGNSI